MKLVPLVLIAIFWFASIAVAGNIYGSVTEGGKPVAQGTKLEVTCGSNKYGAETDANGAFKLFAKDTGKCTLKVSYRKFSRTVDFDKLQASPGGIELEPEKLTLDGTEREFTVSVLEVNPQRREIRMELGVRTTGESASMQRRTFHVGFYDFPMIDNTRLSRDQRAAVVMNQFGEAGADLTLVYFPGSYASLKEKVSYDEVVEKLRMLGESQK